MNSREQPRYTLEPVVVAVSRHDENGAIVRVDGRMVGVLIRLDAHFYGDDRGRWYLEAGFGPCAGHPPAPFAKLSDGLAWIAERLGDGDRDLHRLMAEADLTFAGGETK